MPTEIVTPVIGDLTETTLDGVGVFDVLMRANKAHLEEEFKKNRIKGPEYSTVYLGSLQSVMQTGLTFLLQKDKAALEAQLIEQQVLLAQVAILKAHVEMAILEASLLKIPVEIALLEQQKLNLEDELLTSAKQRLKLDQETQNLAAQELQIEQQTANAVIEGTVLTAQKCKLDAEFDVLLEQRLKSAQETALLAQKVSTEKAQTTSLGVDPDSVIGKQKALYGAQTDGFTRDAEQKAAKVMVDTWNVRRTTDEGTVADGINNLNDAAVGRAVSKLLNGVGA